VPAQNPFFNHRKEMKGKRKKCRVPVEIPIHTIYNIYYEEEEK
jgi:hypothetical protein